MEKDLKKVNDFVHSLVKSLPEKVIQFYLLTDENKETKNASQNKTNDPSAILERDFQLREAINLLKGLTILSKRTTEN